MNITVHHLSVLRSVIEKDENFSYFGSTAALRFWVEDSERLGIISLKEKGDIYSGVPTEEGFKLASALKLTSLPKKRHSEWAGLEAEARKFFKQ